MGILRNAICGRTAQSLNRFYLQNQLWRQGAVDKDALVAPISSIISTANRTSVASETNVQESSLLHAAKSKLSGKVFPTFMGDNVTVESNKFTYYSKMGGNPMIQQISPNLASNVRFYSSLSRIIATPKTQPMEKVCCQSYHTDKLGNTSSEPSIKATPTLLSPHLPIYAPQLTSTFSIFHRISMATLTTILLTFYLLYLKMGLICLSFENFYQFFFYTSKLSLISVEIAGLAAVSFLGLSARPLFLKR